MDSVEICEICKEPRAKHGCQVTRGIGMYCQAPAVRLAQTFRIRPGMTVVQCVKCPAKIVWIKTAAGKLMPVENDGPHRGESHFAHCPYAAEFRRPRSGAR